MKEYKGYRLKNDGHFGMVVVEGIGPGAVPKALQGYFTKYMDAERAVDAVEAKGDRRSGKAKTISKRK